MDPKEVELRGKAITKAYTGGEPSANLLSLIGELRKGVRATEELLRSTRIGVTINKLRSHKDPAVAKASTELVSKWRTDVGKARGGSATPRSANGTSSPAPAVPSPAPAKPKAKPTVDPAKRNDKTDKVDTAVTGNDARDSCVKLMYNGLAYMSEEQPDEILRVATEVENAALKQFNKETNAAYRDKMRSLFQNLKNKSNPQLRRRVLSGVITPDRFVVMTHEELKSDERRASDARLEKENMSQAMVAQEEKSVSTALTCGKCKQKKVSYTQAQTRSADEPMTTFCECLVCGNRWKFS